MTDQQYINTYLEVIGEEFDQDTPWMSLVLAFTIKAITENESKAKAFFADYRKGEPDNPAVNLCKGLKPKAGNIKSLSASLKTLETAYLLYSIS